MTHVNSVMAAAAITGSLLTATAPAFAHDQLIDSVPAEGEVVDVGPEAVTLTFNATLLPSGAAVSITGPDGSDVAVHQIPPSGREVVVETADVQWADGIHTVTWRVVSSDGHPIDGDFNFTVATGGTTQQPSGGPESSDTAPSASSGSSPAAQMSDTAPAASSETTASSGAAPIGAVAAGGALAGVVIVVATLLVRRARRP